MKKQSAVTTVDFQKLGFHLSDAKTNRMTRPHRHDEIEITVLEVGWIDYLFGGRKHRIYGGEFCVRWAAIPHQSIDFAPGGRHYSLKIPLAWFLNWRLPDALVNRLFAGELLTETEKDPGCSDLSMMQRWNRSFLSGDPESHRMLLLETEARLLRLALRMKPKESELTKSVQQSQLGKFERTVTEMPRPRFDATAPSTDRPMIFPAMTESLLR